MDAMETKLFRKLDDDEKNDEFIAVESRTFLQSYPDQTFADQYDGTDHCYGNFDGAAGNLYRGLAEFLRCRHFRTDGKLGYFSTGCKTVDHDISDADGISNDCNLYHDLLVQLRW